MTGYVSKRQAAWDKYSTNNRYGTLQWEAFESGWNAALAQPDHIVDANKMAQPEQEPKHLVNVVIAHIKDLQKCVVELQKHGGFDETAAEIGVAADELEAALAAPPAAQGPNTISTEELVYMTGVYDGKVLEREACAVLAQQTICDTHIPTGINIYGTRAAKAIRARGNI